MFLQRCISQTDMCTHICIYCIDIFRIYANIHRHKILYTVTIFVCHPSPRGPVTVAGFGEDTLDILTQAVLPGADSG